MDYNSITDVSLGFQDGLENTSGVAEQAYFIPRSYFDVGGVAMPDPAGTTAESLVEIVGDHILKVGKAPISLEVLFDKSGLSGVGAGEILSGIFTATLECFIPQLSAKNLGSATVLKNTRGIVLLKRSFGGDWLQMGSSLIWAMPRPDSTFGTGIGATGEPGIKINFQAHGHTPLYIYKGEFPAPATP